MKIIDTIWLTGMYGHVGIVLGEEAITGKRKVYIGGHKGQGLKEDLETVVGGGSEFSRGRVEMILKHFDKEGG